MRRTLFNTGKSFVQLIESEEKNFSVIYMMCVCGDISGRIYILEEVTENDEIG